MSYEFFWDAGGGNIMWETVCACNKNSCGSQCDSDDDCPSGYYCDVGTCSTPASCTCKSSCTPSSQCDEHADCPSGKCDLATCTCEPILCTNGACPGASSYKTRCSGSIVQESTCNLVSGSWCWSAWRNVEDCNNRDGCVGTTWRDYYCNSGVCLFYSYSNDARCQICDSDGICESGETAANCPSDCCSVDSQCPGKCSTQSGWTMTWCPGVCQSGTCGYGTCACTAGRCGAMCSGPAAGLSCTIGNTCYYGTCGINSCTIPSGGSCTVTGCVGTPTYDFTFYQNGLPSNTNWGVTLDGGWTLYSSGFGYAYVRFSGLTGTHSYSYTSVSGCNCISGCSGTFTSSGSRTATYTCGGGPTCSCGDGTCDYSNCGETQSNCCQDCGCPSNYICSGGTCVPVSCGLQYFDLGCGAYCNWAGTCASNERCWLIDDPCDSSPGGYECIYDSSCGSTCTAQCGTCTQSSSTSCTGTQTCTRADCSTYTQSCNVASGTSCGATTCTADVCSGTTWYDYPSTCSRFCNSAGSCQSCSCTPATYSCDARCYSCGDKTCNSACGETSSTCCQDCGGCVSPSITVSATPSSVPADGTTTSTISATLSNSASGVWVGITTTRGTLSSSGCTSSGGSCTVTIRSSSAGTATVTGSASGYTSGSRVVTFTTVSTPTISASASPSSVPADGSSASTIRAILSNGASGVWVGITTTRGTLSSTGCSTSSGTCTVTLKSSSTGTATVTISASGYTSSSTVVTFTTSCTPNCAGKNCGSDGCGGTCGTCSSDSYCDNGVCRLSCVPATCGSLGKNCGSWSDGCGGTLWCGTCGSGNLCQNGVCTYCNACESCATCGGGSDCSSNEGSCVFESGTCDESGRYTFTSWSCYDRNGDGCKDCVSDSAEDYCSRVTDNLYCSLCERCNTNGACAVLMPDDPNCGTIDCSGWYTQTGTEGVTSTEYCYNK
ncbi:MAG: Ig-like domain-containing protein, partial [Candidatus Aenigmatarchaeota archaeon]